MDREELRKRKQILLDIINDNKYRPMKLKELAILLNVPKEERAELKQVLDELEEEKSIFCSKKGRYGRYNNTGEKTVTGIFMGTKKGFGFVRAEGMEEDIFIPAVKVKGAFYHDMVEVRLMPSQKLIKEGKSAEGEIIRIISHEIQTVIGTYQKNKSFGFVAPDNNKINTDIFISEENSMGAVTGHKVSVKIINYGGNGYKPEGEVTEILGHINDPGADILSIVRAYDIPVEYSLKAIKQAEGMPDFVSEKDMEGRLDIRSLVTVTIDGEDAKDLDDAITLTKKGDSYSLGVHIADVSHYVREGSPLDNEALKRGTSVYLVDRVIPMLPHKLSNGICSLNQGQDRLALSCIMDIDSTGRVTGHRIAETVINVDRRMNYTDVQKLLDGSDRALADKYCGYVDLFKLMKELADILRDKRMKRGSIDFDFPESRITLDQKGFPIDVKPYERNSATRIIEDFMLITNETVAEDYFWQDIPFLYRTHEKPEPEKMLKLSMFINNFGYGIKMGSGADGIHPKEIQKLLRRIEGSGEEALISRLALRSMKQARYTSVYGGHFGLSAKYYCHFTSPIRRYPDLQIHRIIKESLRGGISEDRINHYKSILPEVAEQSSSAERRSDEAERATEKLKKAQYMSKRIGQVYEGVISSITSYGMYVELENTIEGMISIGSLYDDYYYYDEEHYELTGERTGKRYKLGQRLKIQVAKTDIPSRTIDFILADETL